VASLISAPIKKAAIADLRRETDNQMTVEPIGVLPLR
jgi:hypothetical protein